MTLSILLAFIVFCVVMSITPGPNNTFVLISSAQVGLIKTLPLILGIALGVALQLIAVAIGLHQLFYAIPQFYVIVSVFASVYLLWLAWKIATSPPLHIDLDATAQMGFTSGVFFQWINPKAWIMSMTTVATYLQIHLNTVDILCAAVLMFLVSLPCVAVWAIAGVYLRRLLFRPKFARCFYIMMAISLLVSVLPTTLPIILSSPIH